MIFGSVPLVLIVRVTPFSKYSVIMYEDELHGRSCEMSSRETGKSREEGDEEEAINTKIRGKRLQTASPVHVTDCNSGYRSEVRHE